MYTTTVNILSVYTVNRGCSTLHKSSLMKHDTKTLFERYLSWFKNKALPLWTANGISKKGELWERLDHAGKPITDLKQRVYVQCRQCLVFSEAYAKKWHSSEEIAINVLNATISRLGFSALGNTDFSGVPFSFLPNGDVCDMRPDLYTYGFVLLALVQYSKLVDEEKGIACADELMHFLDTKMSSKYGGWVESLPATLPRRQNPHMHLFEAMLAMYESTGLERFGIYADQLVTLFQNRFMRSDHPYRLLEFFKNDWLVDDDDGHIIEPGHMFEWVWLLNWYERLERNKVSIDLVQLFNEAVAIGVAEDKTRILNSVDVLGRPIDGGSRYWPQTEAVKAALVVAKRGEFPGLDLATSLVNTILDRFLGDDVPIRGGWIDGLDNAGNPIEDFNSASAFYHYVGMATEIEEFLSSTDKQK